MFMVSKEEGNFKMRHLSAVVLKQWGMYKNISSEVVLLIKRSFT